MKKNKEKILSKIYYDPEEGLLSLNAFYKKVKDQGFTREEVKEWLSRQTAQQVFDRSKVKKKGPYHTIRARTDFEYQADLMFYPKLKSKNNGFHVILTVINLNSRYAYVEPMKNKFSSTVKEAFEKIFKRAKPKIKVFTTDDGSEFKGEFQKFLNAKKIKHYRGEEGDHNRMGKIESFNGTLRQLIDKFMIANSTSKYIDDLQRLINNYNSREHSGIENKPKEANRNHDMMAEIRVEEWAKDSKAQKADRMLEVGDLVRKKVAGTFKKGNQTFSSSLYKIRERRGNTFYLMNTNNGTGLEKGFRSYNLKKVAQPDKVEENEEHKEEVERVEHKVRKARRNRRAFDNKNVDVDAEGNTMLAKRLKPMEEKRRRVPKKRLNL